MVQRQGTIRKRFSGNSPAVLKCRTITNSNPLLSPSSNIVPQVTNDRNGSYCVSMPFATPQGGT